MSLEVEALTGAPAGVRSLDRLTRATAIASAPGTPAPAGSIFPSPGCARALTFPVFLEPRRTAEKALTAVIQEAYVHGISTPVHSLTIALMNET